MMGSRAFAPPVSMRQSVPESVVDDFLFSSAAVLGSELGRRCCSRLLPCSVLSILRVLIETASSSWHGAVLGGGTFASMRENSSL